MKLDSKVYVWHDIRKREFDRIVQSLKPKCVDLNNHRLKELCRPRPGRCIADQDAKVLKMYRKLQSATKVVLITKVNGNRSGDDMKHSKIGLYGKVVSVLHCYDVLLTKTTSLEKSQVTHLHMWVKDKTVKWDLRGLTQNDGDSTDDEGKMKILQ